MDPCLVLVGMMGSGKSALGRIVADQLNRTFKDTDQLITDRLCQPIPVFFQRYGEAAFREHETGILQELEPDGSVLATGGGIVLKEQNWTEMKRLGTVVYLRVHPTALVNRLAESKKKRPLLQVEDWEAKLHELLELREPHYLKADVYVDIEEETLQEAAAKVIEAHQRWQEAQGK
jgi:shikimate kinase